METNCTGQSSSCPFRFQFGQTDISRNYPLKFGPTQPLAATQTFGALSTPAFETLSPTFIGASSSPSGSNSFSVHGTGQSSSCPFRFQFGQTGISSNYPLRFGPTQPFAATQTFGALSTSSFRSLIGGSSSPSGSSSSSVHAVRSSPFGETSNASNNPFVSGATQFNSLLASSPRFGASSTPAFGNSLPAFAVSSPPSDRSSSSFDGLFTFGNSTPTRTSPVGSTIPVVTYSPVFGASSQPSFVASSTVSSQSSSYPFNGSRGMSITFSGCGLGHFIVGCQCRGIHVGDVTPMFDGARENGGTQPVYNRNSISAMPFDKLESISAMPIYKDKNHEELRWEDYQLGNKGSQGSSLAVSSSAFCHSSFGGQSRGSSVAGYTPTLVARDTPCLLAHSTPSLSARSTPTSEADVHIQPTGTQFTRKFESISAMPVYKDKSHEELRWEDYQLGDKGNQAMAPDMSSGFGQSSLGSRVAHYTRTTEVDVTTGYPGKFESISGMHVYKDKSHEELRWEDSQLGDKGNQTMTPDFGSSVFLLSSFGNQPRGSRAISYTSTAEVDDDPLSSDEELRGDGYQVGDKEEKEEAKLECRICWDTMKEETSTICGHLFCKSCITNAIRVQKRCPTCRKNLSMDNIHRIYLPGNA